MARMVRPVFGILALTLSALPALSQDIRFRITEHSDLRPALEAASLLVAQEERLGAKSVQKLDF